MYPPSVTWLLIGAAGAVLVGLALTRLHIAFAVKAGYLAPPDPWHAGPVALSGGVVFGLLWVVAFGIVYWFFPGDIEWSLWAVPIGGLLLGLWDDRRPIGPLPKTILQAALGVAAISGGLVLLPGSTPFAVNVIVTLLWYVGLTNAMNLLDNMDGLLAGVCLPIFAALAVLAVILGSEPVAFTAAVIAGGCVAFLRYNVAPARVFLGDAGSMFLGFAAATLVCRVATPLTSTSIELLCGAALLVGMPVYNIVFTSLTRVLSGVQIARGQADHINYRLVALGTTVRRAVGTVAFGSLFTVTGGSIALLVTPRFALIVAGVYVMYLAYIAIALNRGDIEEWGTRLGVPRSGHVASRVAKWVIALTPIFAAALDAGLTAGSLMVAAGFRFDGSISPTLSRTILAAWPIYAGVRIIALWWIARAYAHVWWRALFGEYARLAVGVFASGAVAALIVGYAMPSIPISVLVLEPLVALVLIGLARAAPRLIKEWLYLQAAGADEMERERTILVGAGDAAGLLLRELRANNKHRFNIVGLVDDSRDVQNSRIGNIPVIGTIEALPRLCGVHKVERIIVSTDKIGDEVILPLLATLAKPPALSRFRVGLTDVHGPALVEGKARVSLAG